MYVNAQLKLLPILLFLILLITWLDNSIVKYAPGFSGAVHSAGTHTSTHTRDWDSIGSEQHYDPCLEPDKTSKHETDLQGMVNPPLKNTAA